MKLTYNLRFCFLALTRTPTARVCWNLEALAPHLSNILWLGMEAVLCSRHLIDFIDHTPNSKWSKPLPPESAPIAFFYLWRERREMKVQR